MSLSAVLFLLIAVLLVAAVAVAKAGSALGALVLGGIALLLLVTTPIGAGLPAVTADATRSVGEFGGPVLEGRRPAVLTGPTGEFLTRPWERAIDGAGELAHGTEQP
ncbi:hypothetical protein Ae168Ps1_2732 [Pseudonocardia sp. Ae168_Ps1]|uniref:hypothetical protein n=1 Tax=unclassified Pseudonocardia TaxID=2619320 RepID=UPI00094AE2A6|nr:MULTISPECIES: hypothetical protein [unclassified Pseudonocardia]OLL74344.1 hypothetical protein Ae150APs1_2722 [Pseudonocardia sp. Ae150A_Ps1]OLL80326.1 hypothetical protein Ae168Ps1_2732 [Pseudonocardia sp. Ae168_Ps1]OLL85548.1 hypothetical protein Ae263Ps1_2603c [Pseudonocardia sp. Ae263_Ps1]OLL94424.1 hypothetical protein Ae356Ps1_4321 [Pseudonocardia sp. Ae356_Ps1]